MKKLIPFLLVAVVAAVSISCKDDEVAVDVRAQAVGSYNYDLTISYITSNNQLQILDTDNGTFSVATDPANSSGVIITEGTTKFTANKVTAADNGFTFDLPAQTISEDGGGTLNISGYNGASLVTSGGSTTLYNGVYISSTKKFRFFCQYVYQGTTFVLDFEGTKK